MGTISAAGRPPGPVSTAETLLARRAEQEKLKARFQAAMDTGFVGRRSVASRRRLLAVEGQLSPTEIDALCELRLAIRREFLNYQLEKR